MSNLSVNKEDMFRTYHTRFVHELEPMLDGSGRVWYEMRETSYAFAVVVCDEMPKPLFLQKETGNHVEHLAIQKIEAFIRNREPSEQITVKMFANYSPCNETTECSESCCEDLISLRERTGLNLEIIFASFYKIRRPSCLGKQSCSYHSHSIDEDVSNNNEVGLRKLVAEGITLKTFSADDWDFLASKCVDNIAWDLQTSKRATEDERMAADLKAILEGGKLTAGVENVGFGDFDKEEEEEEVEADAQEEEEEEEEEEEDDDGVA